MQNKMIALLMIFTVLFSLHGFSQTNDQSEHPLLDKYYPRAQVIDTNKTVGTQITPAYQTKPTATAITASPKTLIVTTTQADTTTRSAATIPSMTTKPAITSTTAVNTPATITPIVPVQKPPPSQPYMDTRLGSSSPQYDTWEKNANGAGAVTTSPK